MELMTDLKDKLTNVATNFSVGARHVAEDLQTHATDALDSIQHRTHRVVREGSSYVHNNPAATALAAFGCGLVLGLVLHRREPVSCVIQGALPR